MESANIRWRNLHEPGPALELLQKALEIHPAQMPALRLRAEIQTAIGDSAGAERTTGALRWLMARTSTRPR